MKYNSCLLFIALIPASSWASGVCGTATEMDRVPISQNSSLMACGYKGDIAVNDLKIVKVTDSESELIWEGDAAFKSYTTSILDKGFLIKESINYMNEFLPFIGIEITCGTQGCHTKDKRCLWKPQPIESPVKEIVALKPKDCKRFGSLIDKAFKAALNGDSAAIDWFKQSGKSHCVNSETSEALQTYKADLIRYERLGCTKTKK